MNVKLLALCGALCAGTAACAAEKQAERAPGAAPDSAKTEPQPADTCGRAAFADLVGQPAPAPDDIDASGPVRIIPHDGLVTMDFLPHRLNVRLDADGTVVSVECG